MRNFIRFDRDTQMGYRTGGVEPKGGFEHSRVAESTDMRVTATLTHVCGHRHVYTTLVTAYAHRAKAESLTCPACSGRESVDRAPDRTATKFTDLDGYTERRERVKRILAGIE